MYDREQSRLAASQYLNPEQAHPSRGSPELTDASAAASRPATSRSPYVVKACDDCRRRKIRCNGAQPCRRCERLSLPCSYRPQRHLKAQEASPAKDIKDVFAELDAVKAELAMLKAERKAASEQGQPGSSKTSLEQSRAAFQPYYPSPISPVSTDAPDPLAEIPAQEIQRLLQVYEDQLQYIYQMVNMKQVRDTANTVAKTSPAEQAVLDADHTQLSTLKMLIANAMSLERGAHGDMAMRLYESAFGRCHEFICKPTLALSSVQLLSLVSQYHFICDRLQASWRVIGMAGRTVLESGLNRKDRMFEYFPNPQDRIVWIRIFWTVYILDHTWSLCLGLPFSIQDSDVDDDMPRPDEGAPFLTAMVDCARIVSKAWTAIFPSMSTSGANGGQVSRGQLDEVYRSLREWQESAAVTAQFQQQNLLAPQHQVRCLRAMLYLRANELCLFLCRSLLYEPTCRIDNRPTLDFAATIAKDSIAVLADLQQTSDLIDTLAFSFNQYIGSALCTLCLVTLHQPLRFAGPNPDCAQHIAIIRGLIAELERQSNIDRKLYHSVRALFERYDTCQLFADVRRTAREPQTLYERDFYDVVELVKPMFGRMGHGESAPGHARDL